MKRGERKEEESTAVKDKEEAPKREEKCGSESVPPLICSLSFSNSPQVMVPWMVPQIPTPAFIPGTSLSQWFLSGACPPSHSDPQLYQSSDTMVGDAMPFRWSEKWGWCVFFDQVDF